jgi:SulP family sulfate permease
MFERIKTWIPAFEWLAKYDKKQRSGDIAAGLTVGVMLIPQGMAYAMIAGLPPIHGLYASTIPLIIYGLLGTSRQLAVGPVAMVSLLTAASVSTLAEVGTETYILYAAVLALLVGLIQWGLGVFRLGFVVNFLSHPVVSGFTSAAALIIGLSQLKHLLGISLGQSHHVHEILIEAAKRIGELNIYALLVGIVGIVIIKNAKRIHPAIPGALLVVLVGTIGGYLLVKSGVELKVVGEVPSGLPMWVMPSFDMGIWGQLIPAALAISLVGFMESIAVAKSIQARHKDYKVIPNQELKALGLANIGTAFFQGFPVTGGFSRTAVNDQAGAKTGMASIISAALMIITLLFLTSLFYYLPNAILAAVIMVAVFGLIDFKEPKHLWHTDRTDFWMLVVTFVGTLALGIEEGIGIGVVLSLVVIIYKSSMPHYAILGRVPGTNNYRNIKRFQALESREDTLILRFDADIYYANVSYFENAVEKELESKGPNVKYLILNAESISSIDSTGAHALENLFKSLKEKGVSMLFANVKGPVRDILSKCALFEKIGNKAFFLSTQAAVDAIEEAVIDDKFFEMACQSNA